MQLDPIQLRVLGSLIEKEITTPENYPLSLNALVNACNQRSSRDPVLELSEEELRQALHTLEDLALTNPVRDARVPKYEHRIRTVLNLRRDETAVLCLLMLRGPQTPGELRSRADRLYTFDDLAAVQSTLERLSARPSTSEGAPEATGPLVTILPRQPGSREARYAHLLGAAPDLAAYPVERTEAPASSSQRLAQLETEVTTLSAALETVKSRMDQLEARLQLQAEGSVSINDSSVR
ncbi:YceH family protein [Tunturiibacter psychrotolerans]|uniref:YceH family protein n=1 Tax=Tunturiibacter psychrotolerans TaxID=3069686 RepID=UPI003D243B96